MDYKYKIIRIYKDLFDRFDYLYPDVCKVFIARCIELALQDQQFFETVYFHEIFIKKE